MWMSVPTPVTTMIIVAESASTASPHEMEMSARPSWPTTLIHGSPEKWSVAPWST